MRFTAKTKHTKQERISETEAHYKETANKETAGISKQRANTVHRLTASCGCSEPANHHPRGIWPSDHAVVTVEEDL